jgi:hypothetical protein
MYVDGYILLGIYIIAVAALGFSVYAMWSIIEIEERMTDLYNKKVKNAWDYYHNKSSKNKSKGYWS